MLHHSVVRVISKRCYMVKNTPVTFNHCHFLKKDMIIIDIMTEVDTHLQHMVMADEQET